MAVTIGGNLVGHVELKAPQKGANPNGFGKGHDSDQWKKLKALPNLIYFDGCEMSLWRHGVREGDIVRLGDVERDGAALAAPPALDKLINAFASWSPIPPKTVSDLAQMTARLCRLLRDEVAEQLANGKIEVVALRDDWRQVLAPGATDDEFADGYAQAVTFGLLMARARGVKLKHGISAAATKLRASDTLIGTALDFLTRSPDAFRTSLGTLVRVLDAVDWPTVSKGDPEAWLYFYEPFLQRYDPKLHKKTGSYYTPSEVVEAMVRLTDEALRDPALFDLAGGLGNRDVTLADPATGTGTFLLGVLRRISRDVAASQGAGAVPAAIRAAADRLVGFELQFGPFVVAQLRMAAEFLELTKPETPPGPLIQPRVFITDTLADPDEARARLPSMFAPLTKSYEAANDIKRDAPITVVLGNPPYKEKADGRGGWVEQGRSGEAGPMADWRTDAVDSAHAKHLKNLYVYFWRWATWKAWGSGAAGDRRGIVHFITVAGFLNGPGFRRMRAELRHEADEIWVIDCTPEGHQPPVASRIFQGVQQPVCIVMVARTQEATSDTPARVRFRALPAAPRGDKFAELAGITLDDGGWRVVEGAEGDAFLPAATGDWAEFVPLAHMFDYDGSGVMPGRTWVISPDPGSLVARWDRLKAMTDPIAQAEAFFPHLRKGKPGDKHIDKTVKKPLSGYPSRPQPVRTDTGKAPKPVRYAMRSFDRQWIFPDARLINQANPNLWDHHSSRQVYLTSPEDRTPENGPAISFSGELPDLHHYHGRGGRAFPLYADAVASRSNLSPSLLAHLSGPKALDSPVTPEDVFAWIAGIAAHPAFTAQFKADLIRPGLRVPFTKDEDIWSRGVRLGREVIWLHTYGTRYADPTDGRLASAPRTAPAPTIPAGGAIPTGSDHFPDEMRYDPAARRLHVGSGHIDNVPPEVWDYEVSGKHVLRQWFSYRKANRERPIIGDKRPPSPLEEIKPDGWPSEYTTDLLDLIHVLARLVALEADQAKLLGDLMAAGPLDLGVLDLGSTGVRTGVGNGQDERQSAMDV